jgi:sigma-B regulation protein RsbU (phosphoserine phosphatase)
LENESVFDEEMATMRAGEPLVLTMSRASPDGGRETYETTVVPVPVARGFQLYAAAVVNFIFIYVLPTFCILLAFWVLFVRPADPLAWILLFVLLGLSSLSFEGYWNQATLLGAFQKIFFGCWAIAMLLFGSTFRNGGCSTKNFPWAKWLLIVPLGFQIVLTLIGIFRAYTGLNLYEYLGPLPNAYGSIGFFVNMLAIGLFFAALGYKSGTTQNPDARRRLRLMLYGTSLAITPSFSYRDLSFHHGCPGSFTEIVPFWIALIALLLMLFFPLTMAYVIVVYRAMDVSVVVRQACSMRWLRAASALFRCCSFSGSECLCGGRSTPTGPACPRRSRSSSAV